MTRKNRNTVSKIVNILTLLVIIIVLSLFAFKTYQDYQLDKEDERIAAELENLLMNDLQLYEEVLPEDEVSDTGIIVLPASNEDLLIANVSYVGIIEIPALNLRKAIVNGTTRKDIANKVGYDTHTAKPGSIGNTVLAAHNANNFFGRIHKLSNGDSIIVTTRDGKFTYKVFDIFRVHKSEVWVYNAVSGHDKIVTLITCYTPNIDYRWIVRGELVE